MTEPKRIIVRATTTETGDLHLDNAGYSLLFGIPETDLIVGEEHSADRWRAAARRIKEAEAHGSGKGLGAVLAYYADVERDGAELVLLERDDQDAAHDA
ncbi:hypothetical protein [Mycolicibacter arupensis]|jgi:hypothetical protein|uniref:Uncharacterized protein n=1 Tax=Mycolicibacter arupensis TaxID=342002 RepID=A0A0F5MUQ8_9MYCO|nr:hypothetical protein [Mycolicibacter arupensis]KKB98558.1 hypothetical protein WR43_13850 [Mycolicibacter arupensis]MCV7274133.1 hypothetical protein [Mycolicibacter arupensis]OQZ94087.1 hypothetical protein BST15_17205 [Mycolicibacter arupensis]TXI59977.1 MAG: hypothetical protein E6Q54_01540 [Mycolicibacter arupensis]